MNGTRHGGEHNGQSRNSGLLSLSGSSPGRVEGPGGVTSWWAGVKHGTAQRAEGALQRLQVVDTDSGGPPKRTTAADELGQR